MYPLSAIQTMMPGLGPVPLPKNIPASEMQKLTGLGGSAGASGAPGAGSFSGALEKMINEVNNKQAAAGQAVHDLQSGQTASLHQTMIAMEEASVSFQLMVEVRNKVLEWYQELMRMQI